MDILYMSCNSGNPDYALNVYGSPDQQTAVPGGGNLIQMNNPMKGGRGRKSSRRGRKGGRKSSRGYGGSFGLGEVALPAGLVLLNQYTNQRLIGNKYNYKDNKRGSKSYFSKGGNAPVHRSGGNAPIIPGLNVGGNAPVIPGLNVGGNAPVIPGLNIGGNAPVIPGLNIGGNAQVHHGGSGKSPLPPPHYSGGFPAATVPLLLVAANDNRIYNRERGYKGKYKGKRVSMGGRSRRRSSRRKGGNVKR